MSEEERRTELDRAAEAEAAALGYTGLPANRQLPALVFAWRNPWVRAIVYLALIAVLILILYRARNGYVFALQVGFFGFVLAYLLNPVVGLLMRLRLNRVLAVVVTYLLLLVLLGLGSLLISRVVVEAASFVNLIPDAFDRLTEMAAGVQAWATSWLERLPFIFSESPSGFDPEGLLGTELRDRFIELLQEWAGALATLLEDLLTRGPSMLFSGASAVISVTLQIALIVLASVYFLYDYPRFTANFRRFVPVAQRPLLTDIGEKADLAVGGYLRGQIFITSMLGVLIWVGLSIIGVPLATAIAFIAAVFNLVPYLGPVIGAVPAVLLGLTVSPLTAILAVAVFIVANQLEGNVLSPMILSRSTNLHPVTVLLAIMAGLGLHGLVGALVAVPLVALSKVLLEDYVLKRPEFATVPPPAIDGHTFDDQQG